MPKVVPKAVSDPSEMVQNLAQLLAQRNAKAVALAASKSEQLPSSSSTNAAGSGSVAASSGHSTASAAGNASASTGSAKDTAAASSPKPTNSKLYAIYGRPHVASPKKKRAPKAKGKAKPKKETKPKTTEEPQPTEDPIEDSPLIDTEDPIEESPLIEETQKKPAMKRPASSGRKVLKRPAAQPNVKDTKMEQAEQEDHLGSEEPVKDDDSM